MMFDKQCGEHRWEEKGRTFERGNNGPPWPTGGFTLVELLVVITIVSVLAALLLPALKNAREQGRRIKCMSNLRQITLATISYTDDWKGKVPTAGLVCGLLLPYMGMKGWDYGTSHVFYCPSSTGKPLIYGDYGAGYDLGGAYTFGGGVSYQSYGYNSHITDWPWFVQSGYGIATIQEVKVPGKAFWAVDCTSVRFDAFYPWFVPAYRHGGHGAVPSNKIDGSGFNASFVDGHVEWVSWKKCMDWINAGCPPADPFLWW